MDTRFDRNERLFGKIGQGKISQTKAAIVGLGGVGTHVAQQLALLGIRKFALIDGEEFDDSNRNRYVGADYIDPVPGTLKVNLGERLIKRIDPTIEVIKVPEFLISDAGFEQVRAAGFAIGSLDSEGARLVLNELCSAYNIPYIDLATDIHPGQSITYGGRVFVNMDGAGCLMCMGEIDIVEASLDLQSPAERMNRRAIYGIDKDELAEAGPSVVSINGVIASLGVTEFMAAVTGLRQPKRKISYYGHTGRMSLSLDEPPGNCYYCNEIRGKGASAGVERYLGTRP
jgi:molybdopterin/thiamine biosynthesis adenylyltransferase